MSKALAVGRSPQDIAATSEQFIASTFHARSQVLLPDDNGKLQPLTHPQGMTPWDDAIAQWSFDKGLPAGAGTDTLPGVPYQILPLKSGEKTYGLVVVEPGNLRQLMIPEQQRLLETDSALTALNARYARQYVWRLWSAIATAATLALLVQGLEGNVPDELAIPALLLFPPSLVVCIVSCCLRGATHKRIARLLDEKTRPPATGPANMPDRH